MEEEEASQPLVPNRCFHHTRVGSLLLFSTNLNLRTFLLFLCLWQYFFWALLDDISSRERKKEVTYFFPAILWLPGPSPAVKWSYSKNHQECVQSPPHLPPPLYFLTLIPPGYDLYKLGLLILKSWSTMKEGKQAVKQRKLVGLSFLPRSPCGNWKDLVIWTRSLQEPIFLPQVLTLSFKFHCTEYYWWWVGQLNCISILLNCSSKVDLSCFIWVLLITLTCNLGGPPS